MSKKFLNSEVYVIRSTYSTIQANWVWLWVFGWFENRVCFSIHIMVASYMIPQPINLMDIAAKLLPHVLHAPSHLLLPPPLLSGFYSIDFSHAWRHPTSQSVYPVISRTSIPRFFYRKIHRAFLKPISDVQRLPSQLTIARLCVPIVVSPTPNKPLGRF